MRLEAGKNLDKFRARAGDLVDQHFAKRAERNPYLMQVYGRKVAAAQMYLAELSEAKGVSVSPPMALAIEAGERGVPVHELAQAVLIKAQENWDVLDGLEIERQQVKAAVRAARSVEDIEAVIGRYGLSYA